MERETTRERSGIRIESERPSPQGGSVQLKTLMNEMDMELRVVDRYFKIHRTIVEMLETRGYSISSEEKNSTLHLHDFMKYLKMKKEIECRNTIEDILIYLLDQKYIVDESQVNMIERFKRENIPDLSKSIDASDLSREITKYFKKTSKNTRDLEDVIMDKLKEYDLNKTVEYLNQVYEKNGDSCEYIFTYYHYNSESEKKEGKKRINDVIREILDIQKRHVNVKDIIFIAENKLNTQMVDDLKRYTEKMKITIFQGDYLLFNITKHFLVPKHHLMENEEMKDFLKDKEKGFVHKLPKIYESDPISRFYGAKVGQIFKIIRENLSDDSMIRYSEFYRYVVPEIKK
jgi:DNA-directed RNA polymerase subunit H (RpoH/RPB5)